MGQRLALKVPLSHPESDVHVRYICGILRTRMSLEEFFAATIYMFTAMRSDPRVVGINLIGPEDTPKSRAEYDAQLRIIDFLWHKFGEPAVTLHAGELTTTYAPVESMWDRISSSIIMGHARRIGHGISIAWEQDVVGTLNMMRTRGVLVEVNLSSNEDILDVTGAEHPFAMYLGAGVPICLTTDDEGISRSNITLEYVKAVQSFDLDYETLKELSRNCLEYSFAPGSSLFVDHNFRIVREDLRDLAKEGWRLTDENRAQLKMDIKLTRQVMLERAFLLFEESLSNGFVEP